MANNPQTSGAQSLRPPALGSMGSQNFGQPFPMQYRPIVPGQQGQQFMPVASSSQQFRTLGQGMPPSQSQPSQFTQQMQQLPSRPGHAATPSSQAIPMPYNIQPNMNFVSGSPQFKQTATPNSHMPLSSSYTFTPSSYGQPQNTMNMSSQFQPVSQMHGPVVPVGGQPWLPSGSQGAPVTPVQQSGQQSSASASAVNVATAQQTSSDWQEFEAGDGRRYYYNKKTKQSSWEKPLELMTPLERADASTVWKEFTTPEGRKYYYNKDTKQSKWIIPEELKLAREEAEKAAAQGTQLETATNSNAPASLALSVPEQPSTAGTSVSSSPLPVTPVVPPFNAASSTGALGSSALPAVHAAPISAVGVSSVQETVTQTPAVVTGNMGAPVAPANADTTAINSFGNPSSQDVANSLDGTSMQDIEEAKKGMVVSGKINVTPLEEKTVDEEPLVYASKQEAKNAFKALLESANVEADWTWEQAMRVIINDRRYGALKTLGERKQAFNEYLMQRKKLEAEERRLRQRKAKEEFTKMLEESKELTSSTRWSKAITMFEDDERFKAVERAGDREDLFKNYLVDLQKKEKAKAQEEYRQNRLEYRQFLETCGLIKVDTQWRKVQDRLEDDERCSRLEKIDRLEVFQEYIRDLEKEEDEQRKIKKEQMKRAERRNRDEFRKMMEEHVGAGTLTAKTHWRDYCLKVKDSASYQAVASNTSGSTPKDLFEDVTEELETQYHDDKNRVKDAMKLEKITVTSTWMYEDFKAAILEAIGSPPISDINLQLVFEDLRERAKEKEDKEAKKRQRLAKDFTDKLSTIKEITATSNWEDCKEVFEESSEYRSLGEESIARDIFEEYIARLQEKAKEKERKREEEKAKKEKEREEKEKRKEKERREKEREREREREKEKGKERSKKDETENTENVDVTDSYGPKEDKKREKEKERKHRKRHQSSTADDLSSDKDEKEDSKKSRRHATDDVISSDKEDKEDSKKSRRHGSDRKKSRKHAYTPESDGESRHKKHRRDHRDGSRRNGSGYEELEDGELGEDGEIR
ncbi:hypothetical protein LguiB_019872 [Lonicera macranthoides]